MSEENHAEQNAKAWAASIAQMVAALECDYDRLEELSDERANLAETLKDMQDDTSPFSPSEIQDARKELATWDEENGEELRELIESATIDGDRMKDANAARERIEQSPLDIQVRSGWRSGSDDHGDPEEFYILLSTGGPALRIIGELDGGQPSRAWLEYQDWGTGWTQYFDIEQSTLLTFCSVFYFGE